MKHLTKSQLRYAQLFTNLDAALAETKKSIAFDDGTAAGCAEELSSAAHAVFETSASLIAELGADAAAEFCQDFDSTGISCTDHINDVFGPIHTEIASHRAQQFSQSYDVAMSREHSTLHRTLQGTN